MPAVPVDNISPYHEVLKECQFAAIEKDEAYPLPLPVVQNLLKMWPRPHCCHHSRKLRIF